MEIIYLLLLIVAFGCFAVAAFAHSAVGRTSVNLVAAGLAAWVLVPLIQQIVALD